MSSCNESTTHCSFSGLRWVEPRDFQNECLWLILAQSGKCICFKLCILKASRCLFTQFSLKWIFGTSECVYACV